MENKALQVPLQIYILMFTFQPKGIRKNITVKNMSGKSLNKPTKEINKQGEEVGREN